MYTESIEMYVRWLFAVIQLYPKKKKTFEGVQYLAGSCMMMDLCHYHD